MRNHAAPHVRATSSTSGPICIRLVLKNWVLMGAARNTNAAASPATLPYSTERSGVARNSQSSARLISTPGTAHGDHASMSAARRTGER